MHVYMFEYTCERNLCKWISNRLYMQDDYVYIYRQSQYSNTWESKCLALIAQVVRAFGMNPKVTVSSPPQVSKFLTLLQEYPLVRKLPRATRNVQKNKSYVGLFISYVALFISYVGLIKSYVGLCNSYVGDKIS